MSVELDVRDQENAAYGLALAEEIFTSERRAAIAKYVNIDPDDPGFLPFLAVAARYGLDPMTGEIWLIKGKRQKVQDADGRERWRDVYRPSAGRDGFLKVARGHAEFQNVVGDVVHYRDSFEVRVRRPGDPEDLPDAGGGRVVVHEYPNLADVIREEAGNENFRPSRYRGPVLGAWAIAYWKGRRPVYYFAGIEEHGKTKVDDHGKRDWDGAWSYTSAMILKAAYSHVLRLSSGISGIVPADEIREGEPAREVDAATTAVEYPTFISDATRDRLDDALAHASAIDPNLWNPAKLEMYFSSARTDDDLARLVERIEDETATEADRLAARDERVEIADAEVVPDEASGPEAA